MVIAVNSLRKSSEALPMHCICDANQARFPRAETLSIPCSLLPQLVLIHLLQNQIHAMDTVCRIRGQDIGNGT